MAEQDVTAPLDETSSPPGSNGAPTANGAPVSRPDAGPAADELVEEFGPRIAAARARFADAADRMRRAADAMQDDGLPPSYRLVQALGDCHREFLRLRHDLTTRAGEVGSPLPPLETLAGIGDCERFLDSLNPPQRPIPTLDAPAAAAETPAPDPEPAVLPSDIATVRDEEPPREDATAEPVVVGPVQPVSALPETHEPEATEQGPDHPGEEVRRGALALLDRAIRLRVRDGSELPSLNELQSWARGLRGRIEAGAGTELPEEAVSIAAGEHPIAGLLTVADGVAALDDAEWAALHTRVSEAFGRPLAVAAARGRLVVEADQGPQ